MSRIGYTNSLNSNADATNSSHTLWRQTRVWRRLDRADRVLIIRR
jgi:hypothetical protein